jgi:hypothetical protein
MGGGFRGVNYGVQRWVFSLFYRLWGIFAGLCTGYYNFARKNDFLRGKNYKEIIATYTKCFAGKNVKHC